MAVSKKQVAFDLDTKALKIYYPAESLNNAYDVIKRHIENSGFKWLQGSVYVSEKPMSSVKVTDTLNTLMTLPSGLSIKLLILNPCLKIRRVLLVYSSICSERSCRIYL